MQATFLGPFSIRDIPQEDEKLNNEIDDLWIKDRTIERKRLVGS